MLEMFFLAIYNEEILAAGPGTPSMAKRVRIKNIFVLIFLNLV